MSSEFSTGSPELDALLEELRAGDNVVFYTQNELDYLPFVRALLRYASTEPARLIYVRSAGLLDNLLPSAPNIQTLDLAAFYTADHAVQALQAQMQRIGPRVYYLFEPLSSLALWCTEEQMRDFFLTICPQLFNLETIAYWGLCRGSHSLSSVAAIKDCTQVFISVERADHELILTPVKVFGRYSDAMFRPHLVLDEETQLRVQPLPLGLGDQQTYMRALADKNRELAQIRDALDRSNQELKQRNRELAELNERLLEQSRLYQSLRVNLDHLLTLLQAGQVIGASLAVEQVQQAIVAAAKRLFDLSACRLSLAATAQVEAAEIAEGITPEWRVLLERPPLAELRAEVRQNMKARSLSLLGEDGELIGSVAFAPIIVRGVCLGTIEVYAPDRRLDTDESLTLLSYLASEASIALDNAHLYREVELQGQQIRSLVENMIANEEQDSRRLALDLHDGLVQLIVASYQHLQSAQAWRNRDPQAEERELERGVQLLRRAIYEARRLISELRPAGLDDFGLVHALRLYVAQLSADMDWEVDLDVDPDWPPCPPALEAALFRIVQEATTNARKYADAPRIQVKLEAREEELILTVKDWGKGFDPNKVFATSQQGLHIGLVGIRERARLWGGRCTIQSQLGEGTTIEIAIPRVRANLNPQPATTRG